MLAHGDIYQPTLSDKSSAQDTFILHSFLFMAESGE